MKPWRPCPCRRVCGVAPRTGAWIETTAAWPNPMCAPSPPARGRGLKQITESSSTKTRTVAPRTGAWIET